MSSPFENTQTKWISDGAKIDQTPRAVAYRLKFELSEPQQIRLHLSADERYELFLDGNRIGRGPERGDRLNWFYESYLPNLSAGKHLLVARVWWLGDLGPSPFAQMTVRHAFVLAAEGVNPDLLNTGIAPWTCKRLEGYEWLPTGQAWGCGAKVRIVGPKFDWTAESGDGTGWVPAHPLGDAVGRTANDRPLDWRLRPGLLPAMNETKSHLGKICLVSDASAFPFHDDPYQPQPPVRSADLLIHEAAAWQRLLDGESPLIVVPAKTSQRILIDLQDYFCAYPDLVMSGGLGSELRLSWAESLYDRLPIAGKHEWIGFMPKGNRDQTEGKFFHGVTDEFLAAGSEEPRNYTTLWWEAGRYVQLLIKTANVPVVIHSLTWRVTHYPFQFEHRFDCSEPRLAKLNTLALRALTMGSHEHYTDSPYYEQIQYVGDTRLEALTTYSIARDSRLPIKAIEMLDESRGADGRVQSRYPSRVTQYIWGYDLWWVGMVHDFMMWRGGKAFVAARLPGVRAALDAALTFVSTDHLVHLPRRPNFTFVDWSAGWEGGHPDTPSEISGPSTWQLVHVMGLAAELEDYAGEPELAARWRRQLRQIATAATRRLWDESRGLLADDPAKTQFSEHTQILAILSGMLSSKRAEQVADGLFNNPFLSRTTIYFCHYYFEVCYRLNRADKLFERLTSWFDLLKFGFKTLPEMPEPTRSDCHAWGSHVLHHCLATVLGIRPASPGFQSVTINPMLGPLDFASGAMVHPNGLIQVELKRTAEGVLEGSAQLPVGVSGLFRSGRFEQPLEPGKTAIYFAEASLVAV